MPGAEGALLILSTEPDEWTVEAMRLVAGRCLYGVDINDMAVEMCKLSLWLVTLAKGKPFSFLDHSIRHGDSLLGITDLTELNQIGADGSGTQSLYSNDSVRLSTKQGTSGSTFLRCQPSIPGTSKKKAVLLQKPTVI